MTNTLSGYLTKMKEQVNELVDELPGFLMDAAMMLAATGVNKKNVWGYLPTYL